MSQFPDEPNFAVVMGLNTDDGPHPRTIDPAEYPWFVGFDHTLALPKLAEVGAWINANVPGGCRLQQPKWYFFTSEEDALLVYLRFK